MSSPLKTQDCDAYLEDLAVAGGVGEGTGELGGMRQRGCDKGQTWVCQD